MIVLLCPLTLIPSLSYTIPSPQVDERYRKNIQGSPQTAPPPKQPPLPPRSSEPFSNGGSSSEASAMHRPMEPQVTPSSSSSSLAFSSVFCRSLLPPHCWTCWTFQLLDPRLSYISSLFSEQLVFLCVWVNCRFKRFPLLISPANSCCRLVQEAHNCR